MKAFMVEQFKIKKPCKYITKTLKTYFNNEEDSNTVANFIFEKRETVSRFSLKRKKNGKK